MPDTGRRFPWPWLAAFIALQLLYVWVLPPLHGPDEPSHLEYLHAVVDSGRLPLMAVVPYPVLFGHQGQGRTEARPITRPGPKTQQAQQPPVAYLVAAPLGWLSGRLGLPSRTVRLTGLLWGALALFALWRLGDDLFADRPLTRAALLALPLVPGPVYLCSVFTNDGAALGTGALLLWRLARYVAGHRGPCEVRWLGLALGLALATKTTALVYLPFVVWYGLRGGRNDGDGWRVRAVRTAQVLGLAALVSGWWFARNYALYGTFLVRADLRPLLYSVVEIGRDPEFPFLVAAQLADALVLLLPLALGPFWLALRLVVFLEQLGVGCWALLAVGWYGLRQVWRTAEPAPRAVLGLMLGLSVAMFGLYLREFLFQDASVALFGGRYLATVAGALVAPMAAGYEAHLPPAWSARIARALPWLAAAATLPALHVALYPPQ